MCVTGNGVSWEHKVNLVIGIKVSGLGNRWKESMLFCMLLFLFAEDCKKVVFHWNMQTENFNIITKV